MTRLIIYSLTDNLLNNDLDAHKQLHTHTWCTIDAACLKKAFIFRIFNFQQWNEKAANFNQALFEILLLFS